MAELTKAYVHLSLKLMHFTSFHQPIACTLSLLHIKFKSFNEMKVSLFLNRFWTIGFQATSIKQSKRVVIFNSLIAMWILWAITFFNFFQTQPDDDRRFWNPAWLTVLGQLTVLLPPRQVVPQIFKFSHCSSSKLFQIIALISSIDPILLVCDKYFSKIVHCSFSDSILTLHVVASGGRIIEQRRAFSARTQSCQNVLLQWA